MMSLSRSELLKKLLPGFIPLFVFIVADELWGTKTGLLVAITTGVVQMSWIGVKEKRFDKFILFDTLLLVALGGVSILFHNDLFFKLKPGLIELILVGILAVAAFSKLNLPQLMAQRYMKGIEINPQQQLQMRNTMKTLFFVFAAHTILVFYATFYLSKEAWAFISGGLFYVLFAIVFAWTFFKQ
ncbi:MAG TPA: septation protein IspZ, partial [Mariniphaga sp.]|nr:septation protein IspZ [Mariniphaga sp.]